MQHSVRAARAAGVGVPASGWEKMPSDVWPDIAASIAGEWPTGAVKYHLRWWAARERLAGVSRPGRPALVALFNWGDRRLRDFMADPQTWDDDAAPRSSRGPAKVQATSSEGPALVQADSGSTDAFETKGPAMVQSTSSIGPALVQSTSSRALVAEAETEPTSKTKSAPVPAVADLFTAPPDSQPDAEPMDSTDESTTLPPVAAAPLPRTKRARREPDPTPGEVASWNAALAWWARLQPANAARLKMDRGDGFKLLEAIARQGGDVIVGRFRQAAIGTTWAAKTMRGENPNTTPCESITTLLWKDTKITAPLDSAAEAEGYDVPMDAAAPDTRAEAVAAWANMTMRADWQRRNHFAPNRPECFGAGLYDRIDLADDLDEHTRRFHCYVAAGSQKVWLVNAERERFKAAWIETYTRAVTL